MKITYHTIRNLEEALEKYAKTGPDKSRGPGYSFLDILKATKPGERENIVIETIESES
jgi:hypothetical protein